MKKSRKVMLALLALCALAAMGACNHVVQGPDSGLSDSVSSSQGQSSSEQASSSDGGSDSAEQSSSAGQSDAPGEDSSDSGGDSSDSGSDSSGDSGEEPSVPAVDVGVFARRWVNADTTIDLAAGTMTGTENFAVTSFTDAGADSVIACTADGTDYILTPDADGALAMYAAADYSSSTDEEGNGPVPLKTLMADAAPFGGAWLTDDPYMYMYYVITPFIGADGYFSWDMYSVLSHESAEMEGTGRTSLTFAEDGSAQLSFIGDSYGYTYMTIVLGENGPECDDGWSVYGLYPQPAGFGSSYLSENGDKILLDSEAGTVSYNGTVVSFAAEAGEYGSALTFEVGGEEYYLQKTSAGIYRIDGDGNAYSCADYDPERIVGSWSHGSRAYTISVETDDKVTFGNAEFDLTARVEDGEVVYDFTRNEMLFTIYPIEGINAAFYVESEMTLASGYYILDEAKATFVGNSTNNIENLSVREDYSVAITSLLDSTVNNYQGEFTYLSEFDCIALLLGDSGLCMIQLADGAYWMLESSADGYYEYSAFYTEEALATIEALFALGLEGENDTFTTGGTSPDTLSLDFANGTVTYNGQTLPFTWGYEFGSMSDYPTMLFASDIETDGEGNLVGYLYHSMRPFDRGVALTTTDMATGETDYFYFISQSVYSDLLGASYTYRGPLYDEVFTLGDDGSFSMATSDLSDSDTAVTQVAYDYILQRFYDSAGRENIIIGFNASGELYLYVYIVDGEYATLFDIVYSRNDLLDYIGDYYDGEGNVLSLTVNGTATLNGEAAEMLGSVSVTESGATARFTVGETEYTAVFSGGGATLTQGETQSAYTKRALTPAAFVGSYTLNGKEIVVSSSALGINYALSLNVEVDGTAAEATLAFAADGSQVLSFSAFDFSSGLPVSVAYTITLKDGALTLSDGTNTVSASAADWDYSAFAFEGEKTLTDSAGTQHAFVCLPKEGGKAPLYLYDGQSCTQYTVTIAADGTMTLEVTCVMDTFVITVAADGTVSADYKPSDIPIPPPPPPAP